MATKNFDQGALVRVYGVFTNSAGTAIDPTTVKIAYRADAIGTTTIWTYGTDAQVVKSATGTYYADIDSNESPGRYEWNIYSTGTGQAADNGDFFIRRVLTTPSPIASGNYGAIAGASLTFNTLRINTVPLGAVIVGNQSGMVGSPGAVIQLANTVDIGWRNAADSANISGITVEATNSLVLGSTDGAATKMSFYMPAASGAYFHFNSAGAADGTQAIFRVESAENASLFQVEPAGFSNRGNIGFGSSANGNAFIIEDPVAFTGPAGDVVYRHWIASSAAITIGTGTSAVVASLNISEPNITLGGNAVTDAYTLRLAGAPTEGTRNGALWVVSGLARFDGSIQTGGGNYPTVGAVRLPNAGAIVARDVGNTNDIPILSLDVSNNLALGSNSINVIWPAPLVALGGGAAPTLGTIGGSGPATATQNTWMKVIDTGGNFFFVPVWK